MIKGHNYIGNKASAKGDQKLISYKPETVESFDEDFRAATPEEVDAAVQLATEAFKTFRQTTSKERANFLRAIADEIMALDMALVKRAMAETALPEARIKGERGRTCNQLRSFAEIIEEGSWVEARIDTAIPDRSPAPKPDLIKMNIPLGPVAVFGASNFPLAYSTAGGDTASALATGCPVIVKGHESHLGTNDLVSQAILKAAEMTGMPNGVFSMVNGGIPVGQQLVKDERIKAVGFTGSLNGGRALMDSAAARKIPIPVYTEMGSTNPILLFPEKLKTEAASLAESIASSVTLGVGQFCTSPGLLIGIKSDALDEFKNHLEERLKSAPKGTMLNTNIGSSYVEKAQKVITHKATTAHTTVDAPGMPSTVSVGGKEFIANTDLHHEIFGPFSIVIECEHEDQMLAVVESIEGQLTGSFMASDEDMSNYAHIIEALKERVGRIICNGVPTGVEVCPSMHHGGPYPASSNGRYTSVGRDALIRFSRPVAFQSWPQDQLPLELRNENHKGIWRLVNNEWTKSSLE